MTTGPQPSLRVTPSEEGNDTRREEWEDWEDEDVVTPIVDDEQEPIAEHDTTSNPPKPNRPLSTTRASQPRHSVSKLKRLRSRHRQKAQNAKAGIKLVTDMSAFRRQHQLAKDLLTPDHPQGKFVDAAALKALEGEPTSASVGNWNWFKKNHAKSPAGSTPTRSPRGQDLSPEDRPIVIGIALPSDAPQRGNGSTHASAHMLTTPLDASAHPHRQPRANYPAANNVSPLTPSQQRSVWSPDTPDTASPFQSPRTASSIYSQATGASQGIHHNPPPVPTMPPAYQTHERFVSLEFGERAEISSLSPTESRQQTPGFDSRAGLVGAAAGSTVALNGFPGSDDPQTRGNVEHKDDDFDDDGSPCTLFEEDSPAQVIQPFSASVSKSPSKTPGSAESQTKGWWDHVVTPFTDKTSPLREALQKSQQQLFPSKSQSADVEIVSETQTDTEKQAETDQPPTTIFRPGLPASPRPSLKASQPPIVKVPTPRRTPSPFMARPTPSSATSSRSATPRAQYTPAKAAMSVSELQLPSEEPPPYSPPEKPEQIRYRAVFPAGHPLHNLYPPSPGPNSPAMAGTMSSQAAINMTDIPLTPTAADAALPVRQPGTYVPQEHFYAASGPENAVERERRRHEKEEVMARKLGGFWRGRGCIPDRGCFGRSGREGRKRRRVWLGVCGAIIAIIVLIIVLCLTLIPRGGGDIEVHSIFVNLTDFPPMPTGALSVTGPDNSVSVTGCTSPSTMWSCALPKEDHDAAGPFEPNQPSFFMHIQWDNNTREPWNTPNGDPPQAGSDDDSDERKRDVSFLNGGIVARAKAALEGRQDSDGFAPEPEPPSFEEMWFLGNTTDGIVSEEKAGEPTPFYISILKSEDDSAGPNVLNKRRARLEARQDNDDNDTPSEFTAGFPEPDLEDDGTAAPARFMPEAFQQPVRLYDRGLDTEHYGFYTYFKRTIYLKSVTAANNTNDGDEDVPVDQDGGSTRNEANFMVTWTQTRLLVQMWTRQENGTGLLGDGGRFGSREEDDGDDGEVDESDSERPGTMPYPVTITMDTHGGQPGEKLVWHWEVDERQRIDTSEPKVIGNDLSYRGEVINPRRGNDTSFGGFDGGNGGCKCQWVNFFNKSGGDSEDDE